MFLFSLVIMLFVDNSSLRIVDWHISNNFNMLLTRCATSFVGNVVVFVSQYPKSPMGVLSGMVKCYTRVMKQYLSLNVSYILWTKLRFEKKLLMGLKV